MVSIQNYEGEKCIALHQLNTTSQTDQPKFTNIFTKTAAGDVCAKQNYQGEESITLRKPNIKSLKLIGKGW